MSGEYWFSVTCDHKLESMAPHEPTISDYHPLSVEDVKEILDFMLEHRGDDRAWASGAVRLCESITGNTCPNLVEGRAAHKRDRLLRLLVDSASVGGTAKKVASVMKFLN